MTALTGEEMMAWLEATTTGWRKLLKEHPEALAFPCDVRETSSVAGLVQHIVAVELRYAQRLHGLPESAYEDIPVAPADAMFAVHDQAMELAGALLPRPDYDWEEAIVFVTRSAGNARATRRTILVHLMMHSIRHYAQLATLVRQHGIAPGWSMDYLFARPLN